MWLVMGRLEGKVAIVTGASRGLGEYCAVAYGREGAAVVVAARTEQEANPRLPGTIHSVAKKVDEAGGEAFPVACNVADAASVQRMVETVLAKYGRVDIVMNNAGVLPAGNASTIEMRHWDIEVRVNLNGPFYVTRAVLPTMIERKSGSVINISSKGADRYFGHYGVLKRAVEAMTIAFANEQAENGIAFNSLKPVGAIETPGMHFGGGDPERFAGLPPPDRYVEAAILLALRTPATGTGGIYDDAEVVAKWADEVTKRRLAGIPLV